MKTARSVLFAWIIGTLTACSAPPRVSQQAGPRRPAPEATSLLGQPLYPVAASETVHSRREEQLAAARTNFDADPRVEANIIWLGRRLAYLGRYRDAIAVYTQGLASRPASYRLLRHRGHRFISTRQLGRAVADLSEAAVLIEGVPDEIEPDGQPNDLNIPLSSDHTNIFYHLGLTHYLLGDWAQSAAAYERCAAASTNDDMRVAASYWIYLSKMRQGDEAGGAEVLHTVRSNMHIIENHAYHDLLLLFKGEREPRELVPEDDDDGVGDATLAYGIAMWKLLQGDEEEAMSDFRRIIEGPAWAAFGYIAAEAELARAGE